LILLVTRFGSPLGTSAVDKSVAMRVGVDRATFFDALTFRDAPRSRAWTDALRSRTVLRAPVEVRESGDGDITRQASAMPHPSSVPSPDAARFVGAARRIAAIRQEHAARAATLVGMRSDFIWSSLY